MTKLIVQYYNSMAYIHQPKALLNNIDIDIGQCYLAYNAVSIYGANFQLETHKLMN